VRAFLGLGSNLGNRARFLREAVDSLGDAVVAVSPVYETEPVGGPGGQGAYLNLVVELETDLDARGLLGVCHRIEAAADRKREERWGPRTLDVDVLWVSCGPVDDPDLVVPHPRAAQRRFVLAPLADLDRALADELGGLDWDLHAAGHVERVGPLEALDRR
jgi:2-amino-4-hydroxy-6-hydroxymethyldihydropteridine diphosphokinase